MITTTYCRNCGAEASGAGRYCASCGAALTASGEVAADQLMARLRDATVGEYDVLRKIGSGGMAAVYLAYDLELTRYVAMKVMFPELAHQEGMAQRFLREARTAASLDDHPNVVRVYRAHKVEGLSFFTMKFVDGCSLEQLLRATGPLPVGPACHVLDQIVLALQYAHQRGVVHRDVKPANVMLDRHGTAIVTDFGIARVVEGEPLTSTGMVIGTPAYMSPEQWRDAEITAASDQYALGAVAYRILAGEPPFRGTSYEIQEAHLYDLPRPLRALRPDCPPVLEAIVARMLAKAPEERWPNLEAVHAALAEVPRETASQLAAELRALIPSVAPVGAADAITPRSPIPAGRVADPSLDPAPEPPPAESSGSTPVPATLPVVLPADAVSPIAPLGASPAVPDPAPAAPSLAATPSLRDTAYLSSAAHDVAVPPADAWTTSAAVPDSLPPSPLAPPVAPPAPVVDATLREGGESGVAAPRGETAPLRAFDDEAHRPPRRGVRLLVVGAVTVAVVALAFVVSRQEDGPTGEEITRAAFVAADTTQRTGGMIPAPVAVDSTRADSMRADSTRVDSVGAAAVVTDSAGADSVRAAEAKRIADSLAAVVGPPAKVVTNRARGGPLIVGDSVQVWASVLDARGRRVRTATVLWSSNDPRRLQIVEQTRRGVTTRYAIARAPGGRVTLTARSGNLADELAFTVDSARAPIAAAVAAGSPARPNAAPEAAKPTDEETLERVAGFIAKLRERRLDEIARMLTGADESASVHEFLVWLAKTDGIRFGSLTMSSPVSGGHDRATTEFSIPLNWKANVFKRTTREASFRMTLVRGGGTWAVEQIQLLQRFPPKR